MHQVRFIRIEDLTQTAFRPYGWLLGKPIPVGGGAPAFSSPEIDFWQEHVFDSGANGECEIVWVNYRNATRDVASLEVHFQTQQALVPLTGPLIQVVACSRDDGSPDPNTTAAFQLNPGQGVCMRPGCWHTTRVLLGCAEVTCLMLSSRSTTADLAAHLNCGLPLSESAFAAIERTTLLLGADSA